jgi:hypothetical protein
LPTDSSRKANIGNGYLQRRNHLTAMSYYERAFIKIRYRSKVDAQHQQAHVEIE